MLTPLHTRLDFAQADLRDAQPLRADVALFVGLAERTLQPAPATLRAWWRETHQWRIETPLRAPNAAPHDVDALLNLPVPIENFDDFAALFETRRPVASAPGLLVPTSLAAAVRAFFDCGGTRCYVVRCDDPLEFGVASAQALLARHGLGHVSALPGYDQRVTTTDGAWESWAGLQWAYGLDDVSIACLPDLVEAWAAPAPPAPIPEEVGVPEERFVTCAIAPPGDALAEQRLRLIAAPSIAPGIALDRWRQAIAHALALLGGRNTAFNRRDMMLVASLPLLQDDPTQRLGLDPQPDQGARAAEHVATVFDRVDADDADASDLRHAQLQLVWPWLRSARSRLAPQGLEPPEGAFAGALARNALERGSFRSLVGLAANGVVDTWPRLERAFADGLLRQAGLARPPRHDELLNLCLRETGPRDVAAFRWASDCTSAEDPLLGIAPLRRLIASLVREARRIGADFAHEPNGETTWFRVRIALEALGRVLWRSGALDGGALEAAFSVRCDRRTMTQDDLDAGRLIAEVSFQPALPIQRIQIRLALLDGLVAALPVAA